MYRVQQCLSSVVYSIINIVVLSTVPALAFLVCIWNLLTLRYYFTILRRWQGKRIWFTTLPPTLTNLQSQIAMVYTDQMCKPCSLNINMLHCDSPPVSSDAMAVATPHLDTDPSQYTEYDTLLLHNFTNSVNSPTVVSGGGEVVQADMEKSCRSVYEAVPWE
uniref:Uncharacterized protein n=1 Tax=Lygus hesperus TaxID=30085 RepID=A0A146L034_LYGHE